MPLLLVSLVVVCGLSCVLAIIARLFFSVEVLTGESRVRRKDSVFLKVRVKNNFIMPLTPIRIYISVLEKGRAVTQKKMLIAALAPFREVTLNIQNDISFRGEYTIGFEKVEFFDLLKIFRFTLKQKASWDLISFPRELPLNNDRLLDENEEEPEVTRTKPHGFNKDAFSHLREYRDGESLRHIHWKLSARLNNLIVKQMEANHDYSALIFCDFTTPHKPLAANTEPAEGGTFSPEELTTMSTLESYLEATDTMIESAFAITRGILMSGCNANSAVLLWQDNRDFVSSLVEVADVRGYGELIRRMATLPHTPFDGKFTALLEEFADEIRLERAVYILTATVTKDLFNKVQEMGLVHRSNVTLAVMTPPDALVQHSRDLLEFLKNETNMNVIDVPLTVDMELK
jgi:hypothetical protein